MNTLLAAVLFLSLVVWVGGAVTGQVVLARARAQGDDALVAALIDHIRWLITRVYIPAGSAALVSALALASRLGLPILTWWVALPVALFLGLAVVGGVYALPEYARLSAMAEARGVRSAELHRRLGRVVWVNRVELALFAGAFVAAIAHLTPA